MSTSIVTTVRFRIAFSVWWWTWAEIQTIILYKAGFSWKVAFVDSGISNLLLGGAALLVFITLHYYTPQKNRYGYLFSLCAALSLLWLFLSRFFVTVALGDEGGYKAFYAQTMLLRGAMAFLVIGCMALIATLWYTLQDQQEIEKRKSEAERLSREAELNNLRQQLQPHFLFNSLNSINALIALHPQKARTMVQQLSDFLRGTLRKDSKEWTTLEEELHQLNLYLDIEKVRFGHRLNATLQNEAAGAQLPAMLLQPVVENAIKFGLYDTTDNVTISIKAAMESKQLILQVSNPFDAETRMPNSGTGFGLRSVKRRLSLLFARQDLLHTETNGNHFLTTIKIPQP